MGGRKTKKEPLRTRASKKSENEKSRRLHSQTFFFRFRWEKCQFLVKKNSRFYLEGGLRTAVQAAYRAKIIAPHTTHHRTPCIDSDSHIPKMGRFVCPPGGAYESIPPPPPPFLAESRAPLHLLYALCVRQPEGGGFRSEVFTWIQKWLKKFVGASRKLYI
jgi:hypothetical protein